MSEVQRHSPGPVLSQAVAHGGVVYLAGQVPSGSSTAMADQTREVLDAIDARLAEAGTDRSRLLSVTIWLRDIADIGQLNEVWTQWLDGAEPPARATMGGAQLARPEWRLEITAIAAA
jgi:enamine deaminase RidA (YjgF/YER057c/UK114 family)